MSAGATQRHDQRRRRAGGFSLVEVLIATAISAIVLLGLFQMYNANRRTYAKGEVKINIQQNARAAVDLVSRELRMIGYDPSHTLPLLGAGTNPATTQRAIQSATATSIRFVSDVNDPAGTGPDGWGDMLEYTYDPVCMQVRRKLWIWNPAAGPPDFVAPPADNACIEPPPIAEQLDPTLATVFRYFYYDAAEPNPALKFKELASPVAAADLTRIERITIQVETEGVAPMGGTHAFPLTSDVRLRNI
jgi:prepilin-type N-terminal cleavage/methylation domain-containing protein